jgi:hypothetical protein
MKSEIVAWSVSTDAEAEGLRFPEGKRSSAIARAMHASRALVAVMASVSRQGVGMVGRLLTPWIWTWAAWEVIARGRSSFASKRRAEKTLRDSATVS